MAQRVVAQECTRPYFTYQDLFFLSFIEYRRLHNSCLKSPPGSQCGHGLRCRGMRVSSDATGTGSEADAANASSEERRQLNPETPTVLFFSARAILYFQNVVEGRLPR